MLTVVAETVSGALNSVNRTTLSSECRAVVARACDGASLGSGRRSCC